MAKEGDTEHWGACDQGAQVESPPPDLCSRHAHPTQGHTELQTPTLAPTHRERLLGLRPELGSPWVAWLWAQRTQLWPPQPQT